MKPKRRPLLPILAVSLLLSGCASAVIDQNYAALEQFGREQAGVEPRWLRSDEERAVMALEVDRMLAQPLSVDDAVRIALGYSPAFQVVLAEAAAASADATRSARIANPVFTFERLVRSEGGEREIDIGRSLGFSLLDILLLPARQDRAEFRQQQTRLQASTAVLQTVTEVRTAWVRAVAAGQVARFQGEASGAATTGAEIARRMQAAGNFSRLQSAREHLLRAEATRSFIRARQDATATREALAQLLGLTPSQAFALKLPERLPELPGQPMPENEAGRTAFEDRLDIRLARADLEWTAKDLGLGKVTSVVDGLHVAGIRNSETGLPAQRGFEIEFPLPLFDFGDATRAAGQARYLAAFNRTAQVARNAASQLRISYDSYRNAHDLARLSRDEILPLRQTIGDEAVLEYNGMLIGVFELLAEARGKVTSVIQAIEAERDFWIADAALRATLLGHPIAPLAMQSSAAPAEAGGGH